jgi:hypothetical protein
VAAFERLGIHRDEWPSFVQVPDGPELEDFKVPLPFCAPEFRRFHQTPQEWSALADAAWEAHREKFLEEHRSWVEVGIDPAVQEERRARGPGARLRYEWAALWLVGKTWKEIVTSYLTDVEQEYQVRKAASQVLDTAGWRDLGWDHRINLHSKLRRSGNKDDS